MANLTITVPDDTLRRARLRALELGTSVNALLRDQLEAFAGTPEAQRAVAELLALARAAASSSGPGGRTWRRDDLHER